MIAIEPLFTRNESETDLELLYRVASSKEKYDLTWDQVGHIMNELTNSDKTESSWRKKFSSMNKIVNKENNIKEIPIEESPILLKEEKNSDIKELLKEREKLKTEKIEYNRWLREDARDELIAEKITEAITTLPSLKIPEYIQPVYNKKSWCLTIADAHYGVEFEIKDFFGNILNEYSPEIFEKRMEELLFYTIQKINELGIDELTIMELGDGIDGALRLTSQLMKLRYGVIESSIRYANYLANWLNELSQYVRIKFHMVMDSNHNQLRLLGAPKNSFPDENMSKVMLELIRERVKNNKNITVMSNPTGMNYAMMSTYCVIGLHGEKKDLKKNLLEMSHIYGIHVDYTISAHKHHGSTEEIGFDSATLSVGSIIGIDNYSMSLNSTSNASCSLFEFEQGKGRTAEYIFKLA